VQPPVTPKPSAVSQVDQLLQCASAATFFTTDHAQVCATLPLGPAGRQVWPLRSALFQYWLLNRFYQEHQLVPRDPSWRAVLRILEACAHSQPGPRRPVDRRVAGRGNPLETIALDLLNSQAEVVEIPRPVPPDPSVLDLLRSLLNLPDPQHWRRCLAWLVAAFRPTGPYPLLILQGPPGSGKSTAARMLRALIDPAIASLCPLPFSDTALLTLAYHHWVLAFDHVTHASTRISSALCRLSTGDGFFYQERYHALEPIPFTLQRPILLTVSTPLDWRPRPDLADRALAVTLPPIPPERRRTEADLWRQFEAVRPSLLGALCTAVSAALRRLDSAQLPATPRFADIAIWAVAAAPALGATEEAVLSALSSPADAGPEPPPSC